MSQSGSLCACAHACECMCPLVEAHDKKDCKNSCPYLCRVRAGTGLEILVQKGKVHGMWLRRWASVLGLG